MVYIIGVSLGAIILGVLSGKKVFGSEYVIKTHISRGHWFLPVIQSVLVVSCCMTGEMFVSHLIKNTAGNSDYYGWWLFNLAIENGVLIVILLPIVLYFFSKAAKEERLDAFEEYSPNAVKVCVSVLVWLICLGLIFQLKGEYLEVKNDATSTFFFNRIVMWAIAPLGIFIEFGNKQKRANKFVADGKIKWKEVALTLWAFVKKWVAAVLSLVVAAVIIILSISAQDLAFTLARYFLLGIIVYAVVILTTKSILFPSYKKSVKRFKRIKENDNKKHRFGRMKYRYSNKTLTIDPVDILHPGHENDSIFLNLIQAETKEDYEMEDALKHLMRRFESQQEYIHKAVKECDDSVLANNGKGNL